MDSQPCILSLWSAIHQCTGNVDSQPYFVSLLFDIQQVDSRILHMDKQVHVTYCMISYFTNPWCGEFTKNAKWAIFSYTMTEQVTFWWDGDELGFELNQHTELDFYFASSLTQQSAREDAAPLGRHYSDSKPTSVCSYSLLLWSGEATNTNCMFFGLTRLETSTLTITPPMWLNTRNDKQNML